MQIGLLGAGRIGAFHARVLAQSALVDGLSIADADVDRAAALAGALNAQCRPTPEDVVSGGVDALVIAAATPAHASLIHPAAEGGLPALCDNPIALELNTTGARRG